MDDQDRTPTPSGEGARARRVLTDIAPRAWEHPADKAALAALRKLPVFDEVLRRLFGFFGEKPIRLAFQANAVKVGPDQFPKIHGLYRDVLKRLDVEEEYDLFVSQTPIVNAGAYGMDKPFIILNSGTLLILMALLEWSRKAEFSCDRAGLLAVQDPEVVMNGLMKMAGGGDTEEMNLQAFIQQAEEYREGGDVADQVFKILNLLGATHPFPVLRVSELRYLIHCGEDPASP